MLSHAGKKEVDICRKTGHGRFQPQPSPCPLQPAALEQPPPPVRRPFRTDRSFALVNRVKTVLNKSAHLNGENLVFFQDLPRCLTDSAYQHGSTVFQRFRQGPATDRSPRPSSAQAEYRRAYTRSAFLPTRETGKLHPGAGSPEALRALPQPHKACFPPRSLWCVNIRDRHPLNSSDWSIVQETDRRRLGSAYSASSEV